MLKEFKICIIIISHYCAVVFNNICYMNLMRSLINRNRNGKEYKQQPTTVAAHGTVINTSFRPTKSHPYIYIYIFLYLKSPPQFWSLRFQPQAQNSKQRLISNTWKDKQQRKNRKRKMKKKEKKKEKGKCSAKERRV